MSRPLFRKVSAVVVTEDGRLSELILYNTPELAAKRVAFMKRALGEDSPFVFEIQNKEVIDSDG